MSDEQAALFERRLNHFRESWECVHTRATHPETSLEAAAHMGNHASHAEQEAYEALTRWPSHTAQEIEKKEGVSDGRIRKRLADLRRKGRAQTGQKRKCRVTGRSAYEWMPC